MHIISHSRRRTLAGSVALALVLALAPFHPAPAETLGDAAARRVAALGAAAIKAAEGNLGDAERVARYRALYVENFDAPRLAELSLGYRWNSATQEQRQEFLALFTNMMVSIYASHFRDYAGLSFAVTGHHDEGPNGALVLSQVGQAAQPGFQRIDWRLRLGADGMPRIVDIVVAGVSIVTTERDEFEGAMRNSGQGVAGLLTQLRPRYGGAAIAAGGGQ